MKYEHVTNLFVGPDRVQYALGGTIRRHDGEEPTTIEALWMDELGRYCVMELANGANVVFTGQLMAYYSPCDADAPGAVEVDE